MSESDVAVESGLLHVYEAGDGDLPVFWMHGTPNVGWPPAPLAAVSLRLGIRWIGYDRPGYGGSTPRPGRSVASAAADVVAIADELAIERFAMFGHSGGAPHALACGALIRGRVAAVVAASSLAPYGATGLDYFAGMIPSGQAALGSAAAGRATKEMFEASGAVYDPEFTVADAGALAGPWNWFDDVVGAAAESGPEPAIDDDMAYVSPWGFDVAAVRVPVLLLHGYQDGIAPLGHAEWLADRLPDAELRAYPDDGHISVLTHGDAALAWLRLRWPTGQP